MRLQKSFLMILNLLIIPILGDIDGIKDEKDKHWYSLVLLNRLMFIWFVQKKGFTDDDYNYLEKKLNKFNQEYSFYSKFLNVLFFEGFAKKPNDRSKQAQKILGKIKYLNGGLFVPHDIEIKYKGKIKNKK